MACYGGRIHMVLGMGRQSPAIVRNGGNDMTIEETIADLTAKLEREIAWIEEELRQTQYEVQAIGATLDMLLEPVEGASDAAPQAKP